MTWHTASQFLGFIHHSSQNSFRGNGECLRKLKRIIHTSNTFGGHCNIAVDEFNDLATKARPNKDGHHHYEPIRRTNSTDCREKCL